MPDLVSTLLVDRPVCFVSGTNGKTTTTAMVAAALGAGTATNHDGANLPAGWASALLEAEPGGAGRARGRRGVPAGRARRRAGRARGAAQPHARPARSTFRDADARGALARGAHRPSRRFAVVANADDPLVAWAASAASNVTWVAGGGEWHDDAAACPACGSLLDRDARRLVVRRVRAAPARAHDHSGTGHPERGRRRVPDTRRASGPRQPRQPRAGNRGGERARRSRSTARSPRSRACARSPAGTRAISVNGHEVVVLLAKNPAGWCETLDVIDELLPDRTGSVVVAINARGPDGRDPSWLWDVPFEKLAGRTVIATGRTRDRSCGAARSRGSQLHERHSTAARRRGSARRGSRRHRRDLHELPCRLPGARARVADSVVDIALIFPELLGTYGDGGNALVLARRLERARNRQPDPRDRHRRPDPSQRGDLPARRRRGRAAVHRARRVAHVGRARRLPSTRARSCSRSAPDSSWSARRWPVPTARPSKGSDSSTPPPRALPPGSSARSRCTTTSSARVGSSASRITAASRRPAPEPTRSGARTPERGVATDGAVHGRVVGTYLHGPVLARNPRFADRLLEWVVGPLEPFDDAQADLLHAERCAEVIGAQSRWRGAGARRLRRTRS